MKNDRRVSHHHESARIYRRHYRANLNPFYLLRTVLAVILTGSAPTATHYRRFK